MNMPLFCKTSFRNALIAASLASGLGVGMANAAPSEASMLQAHSDGLGAAVADTAITAKVKTKLMGEGSLNKSDISVTATNGVVTLAGSASSSKAKFVAEAATKSVDGVKRVDNNLETPASNKGQKDESEGCGRDSRKLLIFEKLPLRNKIYLIGELPPNFTAINDEEFNVDMIFRLADGEKHGQYIAEPSSSNLTLFAHQNLPKCTSHSSIPYVR